MGKTFSPYILKWFGGQLVDRGNQGEYLGDLSDLGNEIGLVIGSHYKDLTEDDIKEFMIGFKHGISGSNEKHFQQNTPMA